MKINELKSISENLIDTFNIAGKESIDLYSKGLIIKTKEDGSPVSNGDIKVNELITDKIKDSLKYPNSFRRDSKFKNKK